MKSKREKAHTAAAAAATPHGKKKPASIPDPRGHLLFEDKVPAPGLWRLLLSVNQDKNVLESLEGANYMHASPQLKTWREGLSAGMLRNASTFFRGFLLVESRAGGFRACGEPLCKELGLDFQRNE